MPLKWSFNGEAVFSGLDADGDIGLWVTNGTAAGTHELIGINGANPGGLFSGYFPAFTVFNGEVDSRPLARRGCSLSASQSIGLPAVDQAARDHGGVSTTLQRIEPARPLGPVGFTSFSERSGEQAAYTFHDEAGNGSDENCDPLQR